MKVTKNKIIKVKFKPINKSKILFNKLLDDRLSIIKNKFYNELTYYKKYIKELLNQLEINKEIKKNPTNKRKRINKVGEYEKRSESCEKETYYCSYIN